MIGWNICAPVNTCTGIAEDGMTLYVMILPTGSDDSPDGVTVNIYMDDSCSTELEVFKLRYFYLFASSISIVTNIDTDNYWIRDALIMH
jgi:hypothetical protein